MPWSLTVLEGPAAGRSFRLVAGETFLIGRGAQSHTQLPDPRVSRLHCRVVWEDQIPILVDEGSATGTLVDGRPISRRLLAPGLHFQIGESLIRCDSEVADNLSAPTQRVNDRRVTPPSGLKELVGRELGHYHVERILTTTRSGMLFFGRHVSKDREVAIKVLTPSSSRNEEQRDRFVRAMKLMAPLRHPNLVRLHDAGKNGPFCWAAMEFIAGESLLQVIDRLGIDGMLDWREVWRVAVHVGKALAFAHEKKVIHRNVTPTNILRRKDDKVCLLGDLMLAKALEGSQSVDVTSPGQLIGDVAYMAPERTFPDGVIDTRSDLYGLGATLYALLVGRPPFGAESLVDMLRQVRTESPKAPHTFQMSVNTTFEDVVLKLLAKRPDSRYQAPTDLLRDLERIGRFANLDADESGWR